MGKTRRKLFVSTNNVGKDDLRRKLPPKQAQSSSRRDITLTASDRPEKHIQRKVVDRSTPKYDCHSHYSGPSGEGSLMVPINPNSVDRYKYDNISAASLGRSFHQTPRNRALKRSLEGGEHGLIRTKVRKQLKYPPIEYNSSSTVQSCNSSTPTRSAEKRKEKHQHDPKKEMCPLQTSAQKTQDEEEMVQPMGYKFAEKLCEEDNPEETAAKLTTEKTFRRFEALLAEKDIRHDLMKLIVSLLEILCRSRVESHFNKILGIIRKTNFWNTLAIFVNNLYSTKEASNDPSLPTLITNLCKIFNICLERLPELHSTIPISQLKVTVELFKNDGKLGDSNIEQLMEELIKKRQQTMKEKRNTVSLQDKPPNDFRELSIFPSREDIFCARTPFLRENLVDTPYPNVDHYLDVQFRLLKEDSLAGLRNSIKDLRRQDKMRELQSNSSSKPNSDEPKYDVKVYHNVKIDNVVTSKACTNGIVYNVSFDSSHSSIKRTNWERSKSLMYGSLVCLISEDFQTLYFATVQNRNPKDLKEGNIQLCFEAQEFPRLRDGAEESYRMVESSSAYFVAYRHILKRLQEITVETMPFKDYIIACNQEIKQPAYLEKKDDKENRKMIDFTSIVDKSRLENEDGENNLELLKKIDPNDLSTWPDASVLGLNESQYKAFQSALCKEFAIIQGPPGTGKTYLGLKIAHVLLANRRLWEDREGESCPILMLSFTNHALDQFLEGLTINIRDIIRAGGRSSSESLKKQNLSVLRREENYEKQSATKRRLREVNQKLRSCEEELHRCKNTHTQSFEGILYLNELGDVMNPDHFLQLNNVEDGVLEFLNITLKPSSKEEFMMSAGQEDGEFFEFGSEDNEGHFSAGRFADCNEDRDDTQPKHNKVVHFADETKNAKKIRDNLKEMSDNQVHHAIYIEETNPTNLWRLRKEERWLLYRLWLAKLRENLNRKIISLQEKHLELSVNYEELRNTEDLKLLRRAHVLGMTTTWASKNHKLLHQLRPRVIIIEEAAEIFEGHVVSSLTQYCQHLILIGDHKQLRPNPSVYKSVKYNLDVSLFERMIRRGVPHKQLGLQHRMRPEISQIVRHIYSDLEDHPSVKEYENVKGISKNLFFVDHSFHEEISGNTHSKTNVHEASFLVALCHYLLRQGYDSSQITILTTYTGQMFTIRDHMKAVPEFETRLPRVSSVDNYQGEENDIILLSLVRSNEEENIGFLKTDNRVCVALSRAKKGLYIIGNREILAKNSPLWKAILDDLHKNGFVGKYLTLVCQNHEKENHVSSDKEFQEKVPNGGCLEPCQHRLECGHACPQMCHPDDHQSYQCKKPCERNAGGCQLGHKCTNECYEPCDNCKYLVEKQLRCGHSRKLPCSDDEYSAKCEEQCEKILCCGHRCQSKCGALCTKMCMKTVKKTGWSCGHDNTVPCCRTPKDCGVPCSAALECGHPCPGKCGQCIQGRVHVKCKEECKRTLICSHQCKSRCTKNCPPCKKTCLRKCDHSKCKKSCCEICIPCKELCTWECKHFKCTKLCSEICDRVRCNEPCNRELQCGKRSKERHFCRGLCGERCICVICNKNNQTEAITEILFGTEDEKEARFIRLKDCEHIFEVTALDKYMDDNDDSDEIKIKLCPLCKTPIEKTMRYGNIVKKIHKDIDNVKRKILADAAEFEDRKELVKNLISKNDIQCIIQCYSTTPVVRAPCQSLKKMMDFLEKSTKVNYHQVVLMESQVRLLKQYLLVKKKYEESINVCKNAEECRKSPDHIQFNDEMQNISDRIMVQPSDMNARILIDLRLELDRMSLKREILVLQTKLANIGVSLKKEDEDCLNVLNQTLKDKVRIEEEVIEQLKQQIQNIYRKHPQLTPITPEEKVQIVEAIGLKQGHWFKCPQGHIYAIGDCGGAMETSRCPECNAVIGGQNHHLEENNELATEMDGARHAAWSEQANLANYQMEL